MLPGLLTGLGPDRLVRAPTVLGRAALTDARAGQLLRGALETGVEHLAVPTLTVAVETNPATADMVSAALSTGPVPQHVLEQIDDPPRQWRLPGWARRPCSVSLTGLLPAAASGPDGPMTSATGCRAWGGGKRPWPRSRKPSPPTASWPAPAPQYLQAGMPVR